MRTTRVCAVALIGLTSVACTSGTEEPGVAPDAGLPVRGGTATIGTHSEPTTFIDWNARTTFDMLLADLVFRRLARPGPEAGSFVPDLAESWEFENDGLAIRFHLRAGTSWEDGTPLTADDVLFTYERAARESSSLVESKNDIVRVETDGRQQVVFHFGRKYPEMLEDAVYGHIYPKHVIAAIDPDELATHPLNRQPIGSGPFRLDRWEQQQFISFVRAGDATFLDGVVVRIFKDKSAAIRELEGGGLDYLRKVHEDQYSRLVDGAGLSGFRTPSREYFYLAWNTRSSPWDDPAVRRAMTGLIDRRAIARAFGGGESAITEGPVPPDDPRHDAGLVSPPFDPKGSEATLRAGGLGKFGEGSWQRDGSGVRVELLVLSSQSLHGDLASVIADDLRSAGFETAVTTLERKVLEQRVDNGDFDVALFVRPGELTVDLAGSFGTDGSGNRASLSRPELDRLVADDGSFHEAYARIVELQPWTFLYYRPDSIVFNSRLAGLDANRRDPLAVIEQWWIPAARQ